MHQTMFLFLIFSRQGFSVGPGCPGTHSVDQAGIELRNPPASASQVLGLKACATTPGYIVFLYLLFQIRLKQIVELAITVKHLRWFVDNLILPMLLGFFIILKDKVLWNFKTISS